MAKKDMDVQASPEQTNKDSGESSLARASRVAGAVNLNHVRFVQFSGTAPAMPDVDAERETDFKIGFTRPRVERAAKVFSVYSTLIFTLEEKREEEDESGAVETRAEEPLASLRATIEIRYKT